MIISSSSTRSARAPSHAALAALESALASFRISPRTTPTISRVPRRHATHQAQGRANGAADGPGKRLGAKKTAGQYVVTGNIIYKQRGTLWFPGENCFMGRDHTIHAATPGYVTYYRDPAKHTKRKYIGVVFERGQTLPYPANAVRKRRLGMLAYQTPAAAEPSSIGDETSSDPASASRPSRAPLTVRANDTDGKEVTLTLRPGYQFRQANWEIGRAAERVGTAQSVRPFDRSDRFKAWRKRSLKRARAIEKKAMIQAPKQKKVRK